MKVQSIMLAVSMLVAVSFARTSYTGYSGAPGSKGTCATSCHGNEGNSASVSGFPDQYVPGQTYTITVLPGGGTLRQFNASVRIGTGSNNAGQVQAGGNTSTYSTNGETNGVHLKNSDSPNGEFKWVAPDAGTGDVKLYVAAHEGRMSGTSTAIVLTASEVQTSARKPAAAAKAVARMPMQISVNKGTVQFRTTGTAGKIRVYQLGRLVWEKEVSGNAVADWAGADMQGIPVSQGVYFVSFEAENVKTASSFYLFR